MCGSRAHHQNVAAAKEIRARAGARARARRSMKTVQELLALLTPKQQQSLLVNELRRRELGLEHPLHRYTALELAVAGLRKALANGPRPSTEVLREVQRLTGASERTIERARRDIGAIALRQPGADGRVRGWMLELAQQDTLRG
jgi:hypothetical protein